MITDTITISQHSLFQTELGWTSEVPKASRMMKGVQEFRATSTFPKWPKPKSIAIGFLHVQPLRNEKLAT